MGNVKFENDNNALAKIMENSYHSLEIAAELLSMSIEDLKNVLLKKKMIMPADRKDENILYVVHYLYFL